MYIELDDYATNRVMNNFDPETQVILFAVEDGIDQIRDDSGIIGNNDFNLILRKFVKWLHMRFVCAHDEKSISIHTALRQRFRKLRATLLTTNVFCPIRLLRAKRGSRNEQQRQA